MTNYAQETEDRVDRFCWNTLAAQKLLEEAHRTLLDEWEEELKHFWMLRWIWRAPSYSRASRTLFHTRRLFLRDMETAGALKYGWDYRGGGVL